MPRTWPCRRGSSTAMSCRSSSELLRVADCRGETRVPKPLSGFSTSPVHRTRWGMPSTRVDTRCRQGRAEIALRLTRRGPWSPMVSRNRVPMATPAGAVRQDGGQSRPSKKPPAAITGHPGIATASNSTAAAVWSRQDQCDRHPRRPYDHGVGSPAGHLLGVFGGADGRNDNHASVFQAQSDRAWGARAKEATLTPSDQEVDTVVRVTGVGARMLMPNWLVRGGLHLAHRGTELVQRHGRRRQDSSRQRWRWRATRRRRHPAHASLHDGCSMPTSSVSGVLSDPGSRRSCPCDAE